MRKMMSMAAVLLVSVLALRSGAAEAYPETPEGLKKLVEDVVGALKAGDKEKASALVKGMLLPDGPAFFAKTFGEEKGKVVGAEFEKMAPTFVEQGVKMFEGQLKQNRTQITAYKLSGADDANATGLQKGAIEAMQNKTALYGARMIEPGKDAGFHLWSFVYVDGAFRFVGKMKAK